MSKNLTSDSNCQPNSCARGKVKGSGFSIWEPLMSGAKLSLEFLNHNFSVVAKVYETSCCHRIQNKQIFTRGKVEKVNY